MVHCSCIQLGGIDSCHRLHTPVAWALVLKHCLLKPPPSLLFQFTQGRRSLLQLPGCEEILEMEEEKVSSLKRSKEVKYQKSYFDVLGLCCSSEVPSIENILRPLEGIHEVSVIVPSKTVIVVHDNLLISQLQIVKALNQARLEATIRAYGSDKIIKKWPSPNILICGLLLLVSMFKHFFHPLKWLAVAAIAFGLPPVVLRSIAAIRRYTLDINILMLIAVGGAVALEDYPEAGFILFLFTIAEWLESMASLKASAGMSSLMKMAPQKAIVAETGEIVDAQDVKINTILAVKAGELIPIDGVVVEGRSEVDEKSLTGESFPVSKQPQSLVWAGTLNIDGYISVRTTALAEQSAVARMARLVEEAQNRRSKTQTLIDSCAKYYTPAVVTIAVGVAVVPLLIRANHTKRWLRLALVLLVSACPCALVLSTPVATFCALLKAARIGLLIKGGDVLENLAGVKVVAFDKTGTLTKGEFTVMDFHSLSSNISLHALLFWVSSIESKSNHPMASALVDYAKSNSINPKPENVREFHIYPGEGVHGQIDGKDIYIGNKRIASRALCERVPDMEKMNGTNFGYIFLDMIPIGIFGLSDTCRSGATQALKELKSLGIKVAMLTGDSNEAATYAQNQLEDAIEVLRAELLPEDKVRIIGDLKNREGSTAMVGDGMNDAPSLAMADVGISMGLSGSAVAMETSHITLMSNDICKIPKAIRLARKTYYKIIQNIFFSVITKVAVLTFAFAGHPLLWAAVLADVGTCLLVILNSMMLLQSKRSKNKRCNSSHNTLMERHHNVKHYARDEDQSPRTHEELNSCKHAHSCHDHHKADEGKIHRNCINQDCQIESPINSSSCQESVTHKASASQEHSISITEKGHHGDGSVKEHTSKNAVCSDKHIREDCCKSHVTCESSKTCRGTDKKKNGLCCITNRDVCGKEQSCSSSIGIIERRMIGGCCSSYRKRCGRKDGCCASGIVQLPEIIIE
ncbi:inactive cadmium/zinc-transporting ATPase HMA3 isoform X3 [Canna indica]|uniref:Inactive cadmium/zinc-transporting ATPase HMA3 isoform X3 n=1 Tax=Canna indica TaxID=4628 RepID=A0AAQ3Q049_9LILI|nr:inactive cadmium/zinc-transporting ATPase HMA3 isoform X3 [Canna indica]